MKKLNPLYVTVFFLLGLVPYSDGQETATVKTLSLKESQQHAIDNFHEARNVRIDVKRAKKDVQQTAAAGFPQINGNAEFNQYLDRPTNLIPAEFLGGPKGEFAEVKFGTEFDLTYSITASQLIFDGTYFMGVKASRAYADLTQQQKEQVYLSIKADVAKAYYAVLTTQERIGILEKNLETLKQTFHQTQQMHENGFAESIDVDKLQLSVSQLETMLSESKRAAGIARKRLKYQVGLSLQDSLVLSDSLDQYIAKDEPSELVSTSFQPQENIQYKLIEQERELRLLNLRKEQATYLPSLSGFFSYRENAQRDEFNFTDSDKSWYPTTVWGVKLQVPIFAGLKRPAKVRKARLDLVKVRNRQRALEQQLQLRFESARTDYLNAYEQYTTQKENLALAQKIYRKTRKKYQEGMNSSTDLSSAEQDFLNTQNKYIQSIFNLLSQKVKLKNVLNQY